ncbi:MAG TPA: hypothetical protein VIJ07_06250 [Dermatophilaceae bacterium]
MPVVDIVAAGSGAPAVGPDALAKAFWGLHATRDRAELVYKPLTPTSLRE